MRKGCDFLIRTVPIFNHDTCSLVNRDPSGSFASLRTQKAQDDNKRGLKPAATIRGPDIYHQRVAS